MPSKTGIFTDYRGTAIEISWPAQQLIGSHNVAEFVSLLTEMMVALGAQKAYVSKAGAAVEIHVLGPRGWTFHTRLKREPGR